MKFFDFGAFQIIMQMLSHDKIIFHMVFGAFHISSGISFPVVGWRVHVRSSEILIYRAFFEPSV